MIKASSRKQRQRAHIGGTRWNTKETRLRALLGSRLKQNLMMLSLLLLWLITSALVDYLSPRASKIWNQSQQNIEQHYNSMESQTQTERYDGSTKQ